MSVWQDQLYKKYKNLLGGFPVSESSFVTIELMVVLGEVDMIDTLPSGVARMFTLFPNDTTTEKESKSKILQQIQTSWLGLSIIIYTSRI